MPELAEVALFADNLNSIVLDKKLKQVKFLNRRDWGTKIVPLEYKRKITKLIGKGIYFESVGKAIWLYSFDNPTPVAEIRLGMTGQFHLTSLSGKWKRHCFIELIFDGFTIRYSDPRRFGRVTAITNLHLPIGGYSKENGFWLNPSPAPPNGYLTSPRISWLLKTGDITGVGNYMANEALGLLDLSPFKPCKDKNEAIRILKKCGQIAERSFFAGGNSFGSGYFNLNGEEGRFLKNCRFYQNPSLNYFIFQGRPIFTRFEIDQS